MARASAGGAYTRGREGRGTSSGSGRLGGRSGPKYNFAMTGTQIDDLVVKDLRRVGEVGRCESQVYILRERSS